MFKKREYSHLLMLIYCMTIVNILFITIFGTGRMMFKRSDILQQVEAGKLVAIKYVDDQGAPTDTYPLNPNGSPGGIAGVCSPDGRHLALMPHPERCVMTWQCPWVPEEYGQRGACKQYSPWIRLFQNAYSWCSQ